MSENNINRAQTRLQWGFAGPWYGGLIPYKGDVFQERLEFVARHGFQIAGGGLREITSMSQARLNEVVQFLRDHNLRFSCFLGWDYIHSSDDENARQTDETIANLQKYLPLLNGALVVTGPGRGHRFDRTRPIEEKLERLSRVLAPLAQACRELNAPLALENHGEIYVSETVEVCKNTPHLGVFLDTGNTYLIGEKPLPAFVEAAPYTIGTHFKDHRVQPRPDARPLHFEVDGAVLGEGDVPLRECYDLLMKHAPNPEKLIMEIEMICPDGIDPVECFDKSWAFVKSLGQGQSASEVSA